MAGYSDKARKNAALARSIKALLGEGAYNTYVKTGRFDQSALDRARKTAAGPIADKLSKLRAPPPGLKSDSGVEPDPLDMPESKGLPSVVPPRPLDPEDREVAEVETASAFHEAWRSSRARPDGTFEPRMKTTKDETWTKEHGTDQVDIANTSFDDLPEDWAAENLAAAKGAVEAIAKGGSTEDMAARVHEDWLSRNGEWAPEEQKLPYADLSEEEKDKDRKVIESALNVLDNLDPDVESPHGPQPSSSVEESNALIASPVWQDIDAQLQELSAEDRSEAEISGHKVQWFQDEGGFEIDGKWAGSQSETATKLAKEASAASELDSAAPGQVLSDAAVAERTKRDAAKPKPQKKPESDNKQAGTLDDIEEELETAEPGQVLSIPAVALRELKTARPGEVLSDDAVALRELRDAKPGEELSDEAVHMRQLIQDPSAEGESWTDKLSADRENSLDFLTTELRAIDTSEYKIDDPNPVVASKELDRLETAIHDELEAQEDNEDAYEDDLTELDTALDAINDLRVEMPSPPAAPSPEELAGAERELRYLTPAHVTGTKSVQVELGGVPVKVTARRVGPGVHLNARLPGPKGSATVRANTPHDLLEQLKEKFAEEWGIPPEDWAVKASTSSGR